MSGGLFSSLNKAANSLSREVDHFGRDMSHAFDSNYSSPVLDQFSNMNEIQLVSRNSGKTLQIVVNPAGVLVVDGLGGEGAACENAKFTVHNMGGNIIRLRSRENFLAIVNGTTVLMACPNPAIVPLETKFRLSQTGQFVTLESSKEHGRHVGVMPNGELKSAVATGKEIAAHFGCRVITKVVPQVVQVVPAQPGSVTTVTTTTTKVTKR